MTENIPWRQLDTWETMDPMAWFDLLTSYSWNLLWLAQDSQELDSLVFATDMLNFHINAWASHDKILQKYFEHDIRGYAQKFLYLDNQQRKDNFEELITLSLILTFIYIHCESEYKVNSKEDLSAKITIERLVEILFCGSNLLKEKLGIDITFNIPDNFQEIKTQEVETLCAYIFKIFHNSIKNAQKHGAADRIEVNFSIESDKLLLSIQDNGTGVKDELLEIAEYRNLQKLFFSDTTWWNGSGIGLDGCDTLERVGTHISAKNNDIGAEIIIEIPFVKEWISSVLEANSNKLMSKL